jgi:hypothetical protein
MDRANPMRIVGPVKVTPPTSFPDRALPTAGDAGNSRSATLAQLRARLLHMILNNERVRRHEKQTIAG